MIMLKIYAHMHTSYIKWVTREGNKVIYLIGNFISTYKKLSFSLYTIIHNNVVFCAVTLCSLAGIYQHYGGICCFHLQG
jgi:hypothetical protein